MRADVFEISPISERVLRDEIDVAPVEYWILRFFARRNEAFAEDHVSRIEPARVGAAKENRIAVHLRVNQLSFGTFQQLFTQLFVVTQFSIGGFERWREHVMAEPIAEIVAKLLVVFQVRKNRVNWHDRKGGQKQTETEFVLADVNDHRHHDGQD